MAISIDKKLLKRLRVLYVEDDDTVRADLAALLSNFFDKIYTAKDGNEGLTLYKEKQDNIDIIIADINMPVLTGIEMLKEIRKFDKDIPAIFATAYSDNEFLSEAIKLKVSEYIIKPLDIKELMIALDSIARNIYHDFLINQQNKELKKYKEIIYSNNMVIRTDKKMIISSVNDTFCEITGFENSELVGQELSTIKYNENDISIYKKMYDCVYHNKTWNGELKNIKRDGSYYYADTTAVSLLDDDAEVIGALIIQKDVTDKAIKRRDIQSSLIKDKSEIFKKSKESVSELHQKINKLNYEIESLSQELEKEKHQKDNYIYTLEKYSLENRRIKSELEQAKNMSAASPEIGKKLMLLTKDNTDLKIEIKKLELKLESIQEEHGKELKQQKVNYEVKIDDLDKEISSLKDKVEVLGTVESVSQKLAYWKEKAKNESKKVEKLEREILSYGDKTLMNKIFGGK
ncbi:response regulator [Halarcobacter ebronensis]|uniref:Response regulator n=1 Tax=Halarcobacter ebronensis TaxID=1462615 RepID=A0A4Q1AJY4_9BACT|nr:response regulator [Halarcobacter ebronensis]QKF81137.1 PAS sensor-containing response regulator [Halarcobacter ebronensis]RXK03288.1 hypothetical protein CRV07_12920 [Halarcobacter ebronensis]